MNEPGSTRHRASQGTMAGSWSSGSGGVVGYGAAGGVGGLSGKGKSKRVPTVRAARAEVVGSLDKNVVKRVMRSQAGQLRRCYEQGLNRDPNLEGKVVLRFGINPQGKVVKVDILSSELGDDAVEQCLVRTVRRLRFPNAPAGIDWVTYPLVFERD